MTGIRTLERYLAGLTITQGRRAGQPFEVLPWQRRFIRGAFAPGAGVAALSVGRGNGKTALVAGIVCAALEGPLVVPRAETVIVASSFSQACIAFGHVMAFHGGSRERPGPVSGLANRPTGQIEDRATGAMIRCLGSDPRRAHGLAPSLILADEPAQWPRSSGERMVAALMTALGKIPDARLIALGTRPAGTDHWFRESPRRRRRLSAKPRGGAGGPTFSAADLEKGEPESQFHAGPRIDDPARSWPCQNRPSTLSWFPRVASEWRGPATPKNQC